MGRGYFFHLHHLAHVGVAMTIWIYERVLYRNLAYALDEVLTKWVRTL